jgi:arylformamidase
MHTYDISLTISPEMPNLPSNPKIILERLLKMDEGSDSNVSIMNMGVHTGTHVDAPNHFLVDGKGVERLHIKQLTGRAYVLYLPAVDVIDAAVLENAEIPPRTRRLLFRTRNSEYWARNEKKISTRFCGDKRRWGRILSQARG